MDQRTELPMTLPAVLLACLLASACASTVPGNARGTWNDEETVADASLVTDVRLELLQKLGFDALGIDVDAGGNTIFLSGTVEKRATQELAEEVARSVKGVTRVQNRLKLEGGGTAATPVGQAVTTAELEVQDAVLESRVGKNLLAEIGRYALRLEVEATEGVVSLRGQVPDRERKRLALRTAEQTSGVKKVIDLLEVR